jgi:hypothetical protein
MTQQRYHLRVLLTHGPNINLYVTLKMGSNGRQLQTPTVGWGNAWKEREKEGNAWIWWILEKKFYTPNLGRYSNSRIQWSTATDPNGRLRWQNTRQWTMHVRCALDCLVRPSTENYCFCPTVIIVEDAINTPNRPFGGVGAQAIYQGILQTFPSAQTLKWLIESLDD